MTSYICATNHHADLKRANIKVIIPAINEEQAIEQVIAEIPRDLVSEVIVVDNGSKDQTAARARASGATVLYQPQRGYGNACLMGIEYLKKPENTPEIVVFLDGDHSDFPEKMGEIVQPILENNADLVIGSRLLGSKQKGAMTIPQIFGNWLATRLIKLFYGQYFTDLGPFRAIKYSSLLKINMKDPTFGWTVEMQLKAAKLSLQSVEVPVDYRRRIGKSKVSGTVKGTFMAGYKILYTIFKYL